MHSTTVTQSLLAIAAVLQMSSAAPLGTTTESGPSAERSLELPHFRETIPIHTPIDPVTRDTGPASHFRIGTTVHNPPEVVDDDDDGLGSAVGSGDQRRSVFGSVGKAVGKAVGGAVAAEGAKTAFDAVTDKTGEADSSSTDASSSEKRGSTPIETIEAQAAQVYAAIKGDPVSDNTGSSEKRGSVTSSAASAGTSELAEDLITGNTGDDSISEKRSISSIAKTVGGAVAKEGAKTVAGDVIADHTGGDSSSTDAEKRSVFGSIAKVVGGAVAKEGAKTAAEDLIAHKTGGSDSSSTGAPASRKRSDVDDDKAAMKAGAQAASNFIQDATDDKTADVEDDVRNKMNDFLSGGDADSSSSSSPAARSSGLEQRAPQGIFKAAKNVFEMVTNSGDDSSDSSDSSSSSDSGSSGDGQVQVANIGMETAKRSAEFNA